MSGQWRKPSWRRRWSAAVASNGRQRVVAVDACRRRAAAARRRRAPRRPSLLGADHHEADPGVGGERLDQPRVAALDLLGAQPLLAAGEVDEAEAARGQHDRLAAGRRRRRRCLLLSARLAVGPERDRPVDDAVRGRSPQRAARRRCRPGARRTSSAPRSPQASSTAAGAATSPRRTRRAAARPPRASRRSAGGTACPGSGRGRRARPGGRAAAPGGRPAPAARAGASSCFSTANASGSRIPEWCATSS